MFKKQDILERIAEVDELERRITAGDIGYLQMGDDEDDVVSQAEAILKEINEGLDKQTGLTRAQLGRQHGRRVGRAQLIVMSDAVIAQFNAANGTKLSREDFLAKADSIIANVNKNLDDETRETECLLTGFIDAICYYKAARLYADAGMADEARKALAGARYWLPRILERGCN